MNINTKSMMLLFAFSLKLLLFCGGGDNKTGIVNYNLCTEKANQCPMDGQHISLTKYKFLQLKYNNNGTHSPQGSLGLITTGSSR
jgi:hypothetical protein